MGASATVPPVTSSGGRARRAERARHLDRDALTAGADTTPLAC